jgi:hypothetical protein
MEAINIPQTYTNAIEMAVNYLRNEGCSDVYLLSQSFYNGIENILTIIVKHFDEKLSNGSKWHKELLEKAFEESKGHGKRRFK